MHWGVKNGPPYPLSDERSKEIIKSYYKDNWDNLKKNHSLDIEKLEKKLSIEKITKEINKDRNLKTGVGVNNCVSCSINWCLRYLGYDVVANPRLAIKESKLLNGIPDYEADAISEVLTNNKVINKHYYNNSISPNELENQIRSISKDNNHLYENSFGQLGFTFYLKDTNTVLGCHSLNYIVSDSGLKIIDSQSNQIIDISHISQYMDTDQIDIICDSISDWSNVIQSDIDENLIDYKFSKTNESIILKGKR